MVLFSAYPVFCGIYNQTHDTVVTIHTMIPPFGLLWIFIAGFYIEGVVRRPFLKYSKIN